MRCNARFERPAGLVVGEGVAVVEGAAIEVDIPDIEKPEDIPKAIAKIIQTVSSGDISPEEGEVIMKLFDVERRAFETDELAQKIKSLEQVLVK